MAPLVITGRLRAFLFPERGVLLPGPYAAVAAAGIVLGIAVAITEPLDRVEWALYDQYSRIAARGADPAPGIIVVAIDEPSFAEIGMPWPWPRSLHATLIDQIAAAGARTIAFDILFDVPAANADDDATFAEAIRKAGTVVLASDRGLVEDRGYSLTQWAEPVPVLAAAASAVGVVRIPYDRDRVIRRATLTLEERPTLALAMASREPGFTPPPRTDAPRLVRFNGESRRGIMTFSYYQALDSARALPPGVFKNAHVLVGRSLAATTIDEQADMFATPVAIQMPGAEVHATILDALLRNRFVADPFAGRAALLGLCALAGVLIAVALYRMGPIASSASAVAAALLLAALGYLALARGHFRLPVVSPIAAVVGTYAATAAYRFALSNRERRLIKRAFQHYVAPAIVEQMLNDPSRLKLGGEEYEVTVLFSDLEGFTTLSERLSPSELSARLGKYFSAMLQELMAERGTLDKLIGDAIMVYFGCPIADGRHAQQACRGALAMQRRMIELNAQWAAAGLPQLRTRVGVNTGRAVAGNMGTETIFNYTILGDCVNLASRLEGVNKEYGTLVLVGEDTWTRVKEDFEGRELDWIRVKGKTRPVAIFELAAEGGALDARRRALFDRYAEALACYRAARWTEADRLLREILVTDPDDGPSRTLLERCAYYQEHPAGDWDGVHAMKTK